MPHLPMPSSGKIFSVKTVPDRRNATSRPKMVTTGTSADLSACLMTTVRDLRPFAFAVRT